MEFLNFVRVIECGWKSECRWTMGEHGFTGMMNNKLKDEFSYRQIPFNATAVRHRMLQKHLFLLFWDKLITNAEQFYDKFSVFEKCGKSLNNVPWQWVEIISADFKSIADADWTENEHKQRFNLCISSSNWIGRTHFLIYSLSIH